MARSKTKKAGIDWSSFVQQSEPKVDNDLAETTKAYIYLVKQNLGLEPGKDWGYLIFITWHAKIDTD